MPNTNPRELTIRKHAEGYYTVWAGGASQTCKEPEELTKLVTYLLTILEPTTYRITR